MLGDKPGFDGIPNGGGVYPADPNDPTNLATINVTCGVSSPAICNPLLMIGGCILRGCFWFTGVL